MYESIRHDPHFHTLKRRRIGVLMGGRSGEREVSLMSGKGVMAALHRLGFSCTAIDAATNLEQKLVSEHVEIAYLALHGRWGEDGFVQGLLEYMNIPYTGSGVAASALAFNKVFTKQVLSFWHIRTAPFVDMCEWCDIDQALDQCARIGFPLICKPHDEGSSIGCHIVKNETELLAIVKKEWKRYPKMFAEKFVKGKELTVGVIERESRKVVLPVLEVAPRRIFYDYKAKYTAGYADFIVPARIPERQAKRAKELALRVHEVIGCHGMSRTDFILDEGTGKLVVLETNTLPGMTAFSDLPAQARAAGYTYDELVYFILASSMTALRSQKKAQYQG
ncbi:MAG: hypothetical protein A2268_03915 [Candidatus Raymondbacteria bacterium RifOxyA12_full_50_37]|uniref:D-alanine--D-alanine ligase n=1 Tax=Candidatus Raymondbacteria bacterium RIFOXYD12_FULL_49_13 TaxID=1817890 RepID=A0A1F7FAW5_UNCRA|nr:MAG: hypothetical protein A2268_03915 [Candidatus Raymondbacteria bacterium RifOxyA12_full_50_37]OGJ92629.1 MAG: hypothetical protein A2248_06035 [Candidatus Raymondbacteria bacterium RIFOXYA2_FULL_49_16]OGJ97983.1 MAG: hypothetical protein A2453_03060 [Candidatus Raymondbacteria bacterium RIFOXYC2_FULL_50_21]OGK00124.1 MAG: hypothetical protein A2350_05845 [Candidatus Raymondbacteria bacterium RifOxyB12_full_50_8]OGK03761.1 MAG: hypothetical protein A2519_02100 [Candidatus Raymondbacteria b